MYQLIDSHPFVDFNLNGISWSKLVDQHGSSLKVINTRNGATEYVEPHVVYCAGSVDAALVHADFDVVVLKLGDTRLWWNIENMVVTTWIDNKPGGSHEEF